MAIEDEIINISDIDVGTEILNNDKLIVETNNGTKLLAFKDLVISEDNITFKDKLVQGTNATGESSTDFTTVTGHDILTSNTTAGHLIKYADISGSIELGKFNYEGVSQFASLSSTIETNSSDINDLKINLTSIYDKLQNTSSTDLNAITITTKPVNVKLSNAGHVRPITKGAGFDTINLDPVVTNDASSLVLSPFKFTYPSDSTYSPSWVLYMIDLVSDYQAHGTEVILYINSVAVASTEFSRKGRTGTAYAKLQTVQYVNKGDVVTLLYSRKETTQKGSSFAGVKIS